MEPLLFLFLINCVAILFITSFLLFYPFFFEGRGRWWKIYLTILSMILSSYFFILVYLLYSVTWNLL